MIMIIGFIFTGDNINITDTYSSPDKQLNF